MQHKPFCDSFQVYNFLSDLTEFIHQDQFFAFQCNVFFRLHHLPPRDSVSGVYPLKPDWASPVEGWAVPWRIPNACLKYLLGGSNLSQSLVLLKYEKDSSVIWHGICKVLAYALLSYLTWDVVLFESSQEDSVCTILLRAVPPHESHRSGMCPVAQTPNPA